MNDSKVQAVARVQITVEFAIGGTVWGSGASIAEIDKSARESALNILRRGLEINGLVCEGHQSKTHAEIVGEVNITTILVHPQR